MLIPILLTHGANCAGSLPAVRARNKIRNPMKTNNDKGTLVISLDFEIFWGNIESWTAEGYGSTNIKNVPVVVDKLLALFEKYGVHSTWGTVGFLLHNGKEDLLADLPKKYPSYTNKALSPYLNNYIRDIEDESLYFAPNIVGKLLGAEGVEVGSHTYCHYYCWEQGQTIEQFEEDTKQYSEYSDKRGFAIKSIIFPRNQVTAEYLAVCKKYGMTCYRGNALRFFEHKTGIARLLQRLCRFVDDYIPLSGRTSYKLSEIINVRGLYNIRASRILKPYNPRLSFVDCLRLRRMKNEMIRAAQNGEIYHIWWHPHNFGANMNENFAFLEVLLECFAECEKKYGMQSLNMCEVVEMLNNSTCR